MIFRKRRVYGYACAKDIAGLPIAIGGMYHFAKQHVVQNGIGQDHFVAKSDSVVHIVFNAVGQIPRSLV